MQIFGSALQGLNAAETKLDKTASRISQAGAAGIGGVSDSVDLSTEMVNLMLSQQEYAANLKSLQTGNEMVKHTLDILA